MVKSIKELSSTFDILSNEVRLCILINLYKNKEKNVSDLQACAKSSQSSVSQQLSKMKALGIITSRKVGNEVYYSISNEKMKAIIKKLEIGECNE
jgi:ArsR family transcriptional regulator